MNNEEDHEPVKPAAAVFTLLFLAATALLSGLIILAARAVINIGGYCAEGGPYAITSHCPPGSAAVLSVGIPVMVGLVFAYIVAKPPAWPTMIFLFWPLLFLGLGLTFILSAFAAPNGLSIVGLLVGAMMIVIGAAPVFVTRSEKPILATVKERFGLGLWLQLAVLALGLLASFLIWAII